MARPQHIDEYGGDPTRLALVGHSAGAHLDRARLDRPELRRRLRGRAVADHRHRRRSTATPTCVEDRIAELPTPGRATYYNAFGTPAENAGTGSWAAASPQTLGGRRRTRASCSSPRTTPRRLPTTRRWRGALGQDPAGVIADPVRPTSSINDAVGGARRHARAKPRRSSTSSRPRSPPPPTRWRSSPSIRASACADDRATRSGSTFKLTSEEPRRARSSAGSTRAS